MGRGCAFLCVDSRRDGSVRWLEVYLNSELLSKGVCGRSHLLNTAKTTVPHPEYCIHTSAREDPSVSQCMAWVLRKAHHPLI